jgi:hypothetical protein
MAATSAAMTMFVGHSWGIRGAERATARSAQRGAGYCEAAANGVSSLRMILPPFITNFTR